MCSGITPAGTQRPYVDPWIEPGSSTCKARTLSAGLSGTQALEFDVGHSCELGHWCPSWYFLIYSFLILRGYCWVTLIPDFHVPHRLHPHVPCFEDELFKAYTAFCLSAEQSWDFRNHFAVSCGFSQCSQPVHAADSRGIGPAVWMLWVHLMFAKTCGTNPAGAAVDSGPGWAEQGTLYLFRDRLCPCRMTLLGQCLSPWGTFLRFSDCCCSLGF